MLVVLPMGGRCAAVALKGKKSLTCGCRACLQDLGLVVVWESWRIPSMLGSSRIEGWFPVGVRPGKPLGGEEEELERHRRVSEPISFTLAAPARAWSKRREG